MSPIVAPPPVARRLTVAAPPAPPHAPVRDGRPLALFAVAFAAYAAIGLVAALGFHVVVGDAESRLAHAYMVWWNDPPKLSAIGFVWPPLQTVVLLPLAAIKPLATSLAALPLTSAAFGAALVVLLDRSVRLAPIGRFPRWAIVASVAANPIVVYYAANGMAEIVYLTFLTAALYFFVRWADRGLWTDAALSALAFGVGALLRYEVALWLVVALAGLVVVARRRGGPLELESTGLALLAPCVYAIALWSYLNWQILGSPLGFFTEQFPTKPAVAAPTGFLGLAEQAIGLNAVVFPAALCIAAVALGRGVLRRDGLALVLGGFSLLGLLTTLGLLAHTEEPALLELRYNIRAIPVAVVVAGWLLAHTRPKHRRAAALATAAVFAASIPASAWTMAQYSFTIGERPFLTAFATVSRQDGKTGVSVADQREMAHAVTRLAPAQGSVLTDDAATFGVILVDGHPERYLDRIDFGDERWLRIARSPWGHVRFFLIRRIQVGGPFDRVRGLYPTLDADRPPPFLRLVHANRSYALYELVSVRRTTGR
jgi:hypothetical protein